jgi:hypothetical protein
MNKKLPVIIIIGALTIVVAVVTSQITALKDQTQKDTPVIIKSIKETSESTKPTKALEPVVETTTQQAVLEKISEKYGKPTDAYIVDVTTDNGTFAKGTVNEKEQVGGGIWFAAKTEKGWELAFDGNGIISCEIVNKYNFPKDIIPGCVDGENFVQR